MRLHISMMRGEKGVVNTDVGGNDSKTANSSSFEDVY
jgi:hypothetical protein